MKYVVLQGDGMADWPIEELDGKTPLQYAHTPHMDHMASEGVFGLTQTIPYGYPPGSDVGTMSLLGYDPQKYHTGRSPIEAASMGVELASEDIAFRCNLVTYGNQSNGGRTMADFSAGHISNEDADSLIQALQGELTSDEFSFHSGVSYRHLLVWHDGREDMKTTPPHDITDRLLNGNLPDGEGSEVLRSLMTRSEEVFAEHPVNVKRRAAGVDPVSSIWLWGQGRRPKVPTIADRFGLTGAVISAVDLVRGIGVLAGLEVINVPGATGFLDTNYLGKAEYGLAALREKDFLFLHVEAPDEAGHMGSAEKKVRALEDFDEKVVGTILRGLDTHDEWTVLLMPDHATPVAIKTHSSDPVPFVEISSDTGSDSARGLGYNEISARETNILVPHAWELLEHVIGGNVGSLM